MPPQPRKIVRIVRVKPQVPPHQSDYSQSYSRPVQKQEECSGCLCAFLGGLFGPLGVIVAAIIGKQGGVIAALVGWFVGWLIFILVWILLLGGSAFLMSRFGG